jgi:hypothetical protein
MQLTHVFLEDCRDLRPHFTQVGFAILGEESAEFGLIDERITMRVILGVCVDLPMIDIVRIPS